MNPYTTRTRARIRPHDMARVRAQGPFMVATSLAVLERTHSCQADAEVASLLKQNGVAPASVASLVAMARHTIGAILIRLGKRRTCTSPKGTSWETAPMSGKLGPAA